MDNVQNYDSYINIPSSQTYWSRELVFRDPQYIIVVEYSPHFYRM
jgi:hypothetical protein